MNTLLQEIKEQQAKLDALMAKLEEQTEEAKRTNLEVLKAKRDELQAELNIFMVEAEEAGFKVWLHPGYDTIELGEHSDYTDYESTGSY